MACSAPGGVALKIFDTSVITAILGPAWELVATAARRIRAQVAELVDALASGASGLKAVEVRVFSWAPSLFSLIENTQTSFNQEHHLTQMVHEGEEKMLLSSK